MPIPQCFDASPSDPDVPVTNHAHEHLQFITIVFVYCLEVRTISFSADLHVLKRLLKQLLSASENKW